MSVNSNGALRIWRIYATIAGVLFIVALVGALILYSTRGSGPALVVHGEAYNTTQRVKVNGTVSYTVDFQVFASCPAEVTTVYRSLERNAETMRIVVRRRPGVFLSPGEYRGVTVTQPLPVELTPGWWNVTITREAQCPTRRQTDAIAHWTFEVVPE